MDREINIIKMMEEQGGGGGEAFAKDSTIAWLKGEFAAANAIIDALCDHLRQIEGGTDLYDAVFAAIHRRRMNWIAVLNMQKFFTIANVTEELRNVALHCRRSISDDNQRDRDDGGESAAAEKTDVVGRSTSPPVETSSPSRGSSQEDHSTVENAAICSDHEHCSTRREIIKISKGFVVKEQIKGHMVNVVKGLKVFEDVLTDSALTNLREFINDLRVAGRNGELSGETFIFFNKELKGNKREIIQLGIPIFQHAVANDQETGYIEPMPLILQDVIDHLIQWHLISPSKRPNSCLINFFDEGEYSQPYSKPPHLDHPISTLVLQETTMAFGRALAIDHQGNYKGSLTLDLKGGSLVVMRGHSADVARHVVCPSESSRVTITFAKIRRPPPLFPSPTHINNSLQMEYGASMIPHAFVPAWGMAIQAPVIMIPSPVPAPAPSLVGSKSSKKSHQSQGNNGNGTGVFLPWTMGMGSNKYIKQLPPRIQRTRLPSLPPLLKMQVDKATTAAPVSFICT